MDCEDPKNDEIINDLVDNLMNKDRLQEIQERAKLIEANNEYARKTTPEHDPDEAAMGLTIQMARKRIINILN